MEERRGPLRGQPGGGVARSRLIGPRRRGSGEGGGGIGSKENFHRLESRPGRERPLPTFAPQTAWLENRLTHRSSRPCRTGPQVPRRANLAEGRGGIADPEPVTAQHRPIAKAFAESRWEIRAIRPTRYAPRQARDLRGCSAEPDRTGQLYGGWPLFAQTPEQLEVGATVLTLSQATGR